MQNQELYNDTPPSLKRGRAPFISSPVNEFYKKVGDALLGCILGRYFSSISVKNTHNYELRDKDFANIIYASHSCWWDGLIGYFLCRNLFKTDMRIMVEELQACPILSKLGAFSVEKGSTTSIMESLNYAIELLKRPGRSLYIFPQGIIRPPDFRPIKFESGLTYISQKVGGVNLIPLAVRYCFLREKRPEILVEVQRPITLEKFNDRKLLNRFLEDSFEDALDRQRDDISQGDFSGYERIWQKPEGIFRWGEKRLKN